MKVYEIKLTGKTDQDGIPRALVTIQRPFDSDMILVSIITPDGEKEHTVQADCCEDVFSMAECLQFHLDGHRGTNADIQDYYRILGYFTD